VFGLLGVAVHSARFRPEEKSFKYESPTHP
jgi:hypothetical protein